MDKADEPRQKRLRFLDNPNLRCLYTGRGSDGSCEHGEIAYAVQLKSLAKNPVDAARWYYVCENHADVYLSRRWPFNIEEVF